MNFSRKLKLFAYEVSACAGVAEAGSLFRKRSKLNKVYYIYFCILEEMKWLTYVGTELTEIKHNKVLIKKIVILTISDQNNFALYQTRKDL